MKDRYAQIDEVEKIISKVRSEGRKILTEYESKIVLKNFQIPVTKEYLVKNINEAEKIAEKIGFPLVLKICSPEIIHKTEIGGVILGIETKDQISESFNRLISRASLEKPDSRLFGVLIQEFVPNSYETIIGGIRDPQFGPMVLFGLGGIFVEILKDVSFRLAPISNIEAMKMIREIKGFRLLEGFRGRKPADINSLIDVLNKVSQMIVDVPEVMEIDINPLMVFDKGTKAVDARIVIS